MARKDIRVDFPTNPDEQIDIIGKMLEMNDADPTKSPLRLMDVEALRRVFNATKELRDAYKEFNAKALTANGEAKVKLGTIQSDGSGLFLMAQARDLLMAVYASNPRELDLWGWKTVESVTVRKAAPAKV